MGNRGGKVIRVYILAIKITAKFDLCKIAGASSFCGNFRLYNLVGNQIFWIGLKDKILVVKIFTESEARCVCVCVEREREEKRREREREGGNKF